MAHAGLDLLVMNEPRPRTRALERRELLGLDRPTLAALCNISESYLYKIETGRISPSVAVANKLAVLLKIYPADLQRSVETPPQSQQVVAS